jgi:hypothetical protein
VTALAIMSPVIVLMLVAGIVAVRHARRLMDRRAAQRERDLVAAVKHWQRAAETATSCHGCVRGDGTSIIEELQAAARSLELQRDREIGAVQRTMAERDALWSRARKAEEDGEDLRARMRRLLQERDAIAARVAEIEARGPAAWRAHAAAITSEIDAAEESVGDALAVLP